MPRAKKDELRLSVRMDAEIRHGLAAVLSSSFIQLRRNEKSIPSLIIFFEKGRTQPWGV